MYTNYRGLYNNEGIGQFKADLLLFLQREWHWPELDRLINQNAGSHLTIEEKPKNDKPENREHRSGKNHKPENRKDRSGEEPQTGKGELKQRNYG